MSLRSESIVSHVLGVLAMFALAACSVTPLGATDTGINEARTKTATGAAVFDRECASCHGKHGEGLTNAPAIMGPGALPTYPRDDMATSSNAIAAANSQAPQQATTQVPGQGQRQAFRNAQDVYDYISTRMPLPKSRAAGLSAEDYWAVLNYMLIAHGAPVPAGGINETNASKVSLP